MDLSQALEYLHVGEASLVYSHYQWMVVPRIFRTEF